MGTVRFLSGERLRIMLEALVAPMEEQTFSPQNGPTLDPDERARLRSLDLECVAEALEARPEALAQAEAVQTLSDALARCGSPNIRSLAASALLPYLVEHDGGELAEVGSPAPGNGELETEED